MSTMTTAEFVSHLQSLDIRLWPNGDKLGYNAAGGALTSELRGDGVDKTRPSPKGFSRPSFVLPVRVLEAGGWWLGLVAG